MKSNKNYILVLFIIIFINNLKAQDHFNASVSYKIDKIEKDTINQNIFGGFTEFLNDYINGSMGLWAQELQDRGFDYIIDDTSKTSYNWQHWNRNNVEDSIALESTDKYNENGLFSQFIQNKSGNGETGIRQKILISDTTTHTFYIYAKSSGIPINIRFLDTNNNLVYEKSLETSTDWDKYEFQIPELNYNSIYIYFSINEIGTIYIDESSLVPDNNEFGIRAEYAELFKKWNSSVIRYPGGTFVSTMGGHWTNGINKIDKRNSPLEYKPSNINQRMDFGYIEYIEFCNKLSFDPYIVSSYTNHNVEDHINFLEFLMGSKDTEFGSIRANLGHPNPFVIKYYEIGNEEWENGVKYANYFKEVYEKIKPKYPNLKIIAAGDHWQGNEYIRSQMEIFNNNIDIYGWHPSKPDLVNDDFPDTLNFLSIVGIPEYASDYEIRDKYNFCKKFNTEADFRVGITEWWSHYGDFTNWTLDTHWRNNSLESGLWDAGMILGFMKNPKFMDLANRTMGMSWINRKINKNTGKKAIFPSVGLKSAIFINSHRGKLSIPVEIDSPKFNIHQDSIAYHFETKYLDASSTFDNDSIYLYFINRSPVKDIVVSTDIENKFGTGIDAKKYILTSNHFLDHVTAEDQDKIKFTDENVELSNEFTIKPFSFVTYSFANKLLTSVDIDNKNQSSSKSILVHDFLKLDFVENFTKAKLFDINGKIAIDINLKTGQEYIDLQHLKRGFYSVILTNRNKMLPINIFKI